MGLVHCQLIHIGQVYNLMDNLVEKKNKILFKFEKKNLLLDGVTVTLVSQFVPV
jgi:hypothetical protein